MPDLYRCKECNMEFKTRNGLWKHNNNYHKIILKNSTKSSGKSTILPHTSTQNDGKYKCKFCNKILSRSDSLNRHEKTCKEKEKENEEIAMLKNIIKEMSKKIENLEKSNSGNKTKNINNGQIYNGKTINNITINAPIS